MSDKHEFTGVFIPAHIWLSKELAPAEKMILGEVDALSKKTGWCTAGRKHFSEWLGCDLPGVTYHIKKLENMGFIEVARTAGSNSKMRVVVSRFYQSVPLTRVVSPTDGGSQSGLPHKYKYKENFKNSLSPHAQGNENTHVEAQPNLNQPAGRGPGSTVTVHDPELPGVVIVESGPVTPPPAKLGLYDRPKAETPVQLENKLRAFYKDWPEEWKTGILENGKGKAHSDEKRRDIVKDFCCWAIDNNRGGDTFQMLNARLQQWFRNEQYSAWKQKPKNDTTAPSYSIPKNAVY